MKLANIVLIILNRAMMYLECNF